MSASSRPTGTTRDRVVDEVDDGAAVPAGRVAVVTTPGRLVQEHVRERLLRDGRAVDLDPVAAPDVGVRARPARR